MAYEVNGLKLSIDGNAITAQGCVCNPTGDSVQKRGEYGSCGVVYDGDSIAALKTAAIAALKNAAGV